MNDITVEDLEDIFHEDNSNYDSKHIESAAVSLDQSHFLDRDFFLFHQDSTTENSKLDLKSSNCSVWSQDLDDDDGFDVPDIDTWRTKIKSIQIDGMIDDNEDLTFGLDCSSLDLYKQCSNNLKKPQFISSAASCQDYPPKASVSARMKSLAQKLIEPGKKGCDFLTENSSNSSKSIPGFLLPTKTSILKRNTQRTSGSLRDKRPVTNRIAFGRSLKVEPVMAKKPIKPTLIKNLAPINKQKGFEDS